jgi:hypothetical protein
MSKVDHINAHVVLLESHSEVLEVFLVSGKWVSNETDDSLSLRLVLSVLERELSNLNSFE